MSQKLLLVDGHNLLFRSFYGIPVRIPGTDGNSIHGVVGFIGTLIRTLACFEPTHLLVVFDHEDCSFRTEIDENYKNQLVEPERREADAAFFPQLATLKQSFAFIDWRYAEVPGLEADDIIAAYAGFYESDAEIIIVSSDSDLLQLVKPGVSVLAPNGKQPVLYGSAEVEAKFGVPPKYIPDLKALTGDKSDNLTGVPGIGPKRASELIQNLGGVAEIFERTEEIQSKTIADLLIAHRERIIRNLSMTRLDYQVELPFSLSELAISPGSRQCRTMDLLRQAGIV